LAADFALLGIAMAPPRAFPLLASLLGLALAALPAFARPALRSGPMLGHVSFAEASLWLQTTAEADAAIRWWPAAQPEASRNTDPVRTYAGDGFVAKLSLTGLRAGTTYRYEVLLDGEPQEVRFRPGFQQGGPITLQFTTPQNWRFANSGGRDGHAFLDFQFAAGSCIYINDEPGDDRSDRAGNPYGGGYEIVEQIWAHNPAFMLWLGDNTYLRETDWTSWSGFLHRWSHTRSIPHLRPLLASVPNYAIWDDHDYGPNNSDRGFAMRAIAHRAFDLFWANPSSGLPDVEGNFTFFNWGDVNFYLLDNRTHRDSNGLDPRPWGRRPDFIGRGQLEWLLNALKHAQHQSEGGGNPSYPVSFHVIAVGSQALDTGGNPEAWPTYREEWQELIDRIMHEGIEGVVFLTGDIHRSEINRMVVTGGGRPGTPGKAGIAGADYTFYEITTSPLTAGPSNWRSQHPHALPLPEVPDRHDFNTRNFALINVAGPRADRRLEVRYIGTDGRQLNQLPDRAPGEIDDHYVIRAQDLKIRRPAPAN